MPTANLNILFFFVYEQRVYFWTRVFPTYVGHLYPLNRFVFICRTETKSIDFSYLRVGHWLNLDFIFDGARIVRKQI